MASKTTNYGLNKHSPQDFYNVEARNENWDKIDEALAATDPTKITTKAAPADGDGVMIADSADGGKAKRLLWSSVKTALGKLFVPLARKVNGKTLAKDVTLTGDDIAMGADDAESLRAAMAKRPLARETLTLAGDINAKSDFPRGKSLVFRTTDSDWNGNMPSGYAAYAKLRSSLSGSYDMWFGASDCRFWFARAGDDAIPARNIWHELARCVAPEVHNFPLADGFTGDIIYYKTQENICTVSGCIYGTFAKDSYISIGYLPEGFHSAHALELPVAASYGVGVRCSVATDGNVTVIISTSGVAYVYLNISFPCA